MKAVVYLDTGVEVDVPAGVDPDSAEGYDLIKRRALARFVNMMTNPRDYVPVTIGLEDDE